MVVCVKAVFTFSHPIPCIPVLVLHCFVATLMIEPKDFNMTFQIDFCGNFSEPAAGGKKNTC